LMNPATGASGWAAGDLPRSCAGRRSGGKVRSRGKVRNFGEPFAHLALGGVFCLGIGQGAQLFGDVCVPRCGVLIVLLDFVTEWALGTWHWGLGMGLGTRHWGWEIGQGALGRRKRCRG